MCGICGYFGTESGVVTPNAIEEVFAATESRGRDASGYVASVHDRLRSVKLPMKSSKLLVQPKFGNHYLEDADTWIGHCRLATHGDPKDNRNNHPFVHKGLGLIHNGMLMNYHYELEDDKRLKLESECDSEAILKLITYHRGQGMKTTEAISKMATEVDGSMACAMVNREGAMWLFRRDESYSFAPLWIGHNADKNLVQFASTHELLKKGLDKSDWTVYNIPSGVGYLLRPSLDGPDFSVTPFEVPDCDSESMSTQWYGAGRYDLDLHKTRPVYTKGYADRHYTRSKSALSILEEDVAEAHVNSAAADNGDDTFGLTYTKRSLSEMQIMSIEQISLEIEADDVFWCFKCTQEMFTFEVVAHYRENRHCLFMVGSWADAMDYEVEETVKVATTTDVKTGVTTQLTDYCRGCDRLYVPGEQSYLGVCAACAHYMSDDGVDPAWECS